jgi:hypothetical protein
LSGGDTGIELLEIDGLGITSGAAYAQTSTSLAASQGYGLNLSGLNPNAVGIDAIVNIEQDDIAQFTITTSGLSGYVDLNTGGMPTFDQTLTGSFPTAVDSDGRGTATTAHFNFDFYVVNSSTFLLLVTDTQIGTGIFELQNAAGAPGAVPAVEPLHPALHAAWQKK